MSGGVDSSVAAGLLKEQGYEVLGVHMRLWTDDRNPESGLLGNCCSLEAAFDARRVCAILDIPFYILNFERQFKDYVVDYFCREYAHGRTPNPCLACNQFIKFDFLLRKALALGADYIATGHYARIAFSQDRYRLLKAVDPLKDQSYVLYTLGQNELAHLLFPVGHYHKREVRRKAFQWNLPVADKSDSQEVCFIDGSYRKFLSHRLTPRPGEIIDRHGRVLGRHPGIAFYTIGQRQGLGIAMGVPYFVVDIDPVQNTIVVGPSEDLLTDGLLASEVGFISGENLAGPVGTMVKIRYRAPELLAMISPAGQYVRVDFHEPQRAATPGQAVVFYKDEDVLGGGLIEQAFKRKNAAKQVSAA